MYCDQLSHDSYYTEASVTYGWKCAVCGDVATEIWLGRTIVTPYKLPAAWVVITDGFNVQPICPKHEWATTVDGKPWPKVK